MRERLEDKPVSDRTSRIATNSRSLSAQIERFMEAICGVVELETDWEQPMRLLLTHPRPTPGLRDLHSAMRVAIRRIKYDEDAVDILLAAAKAAERKADMVEFFEPIQLALLAFVASLSSRPKTLMPVARMLIRIDGIEIPAVSPPQSRAARGAPARTQKCARAFLPVVSAVTRAVAAVLQQCSYGDGALDHWSEEELKVGMDALWLAYTYCDVGSMGRQLTREQLKQDLAQFGAPLWRTLASRLDDLRALDDSNSGPAAVADLARLTLFLESKETPDAPSRCVPTHKRPAANQLVVCKRPIPDSSDRQDKDEIERHRALEDALPVTAMPSAQSLQQAEIRLCAEFPWASGSISVIFSDLIGRANLGVRALLIPPTLLVGPPGSGKSRLARRLAESFEAPRLDVCLAGISDTKMLSGTSRGWASGRPGDVASLLARSQCASALVTLDEIDKAIDSHREGGGINAYLLGLLERETASRHYDSFLKTECDFSMVSWICTANAISTLSGPLKSRLRILAVPQPSSAHCRVVAATVLQELERRWCIGAGVLPKIDDLRLDFKRLTTARQVRTAVEAQVTAWSRSMIKH